MRDVTVAVGATIAPGSSIGTLSAAAVHFQPGSVLDVEIVGGGNTPGVHNDLLAVSGIATLEGGTVSVVALDPATSYQVGQAYTILTADGGVEGAFDEAVSRSAFITPTLTHNPNEVVLTISALDAPDPVNPDPVAPDPVDPGLFPTAAQTYNQHQAATGLDDLDQTGDALAVYNQILMLSAPQARRAFDLASGEIHASGQHVIEQSAGLFGRALRRQGASGLGAMGGASVVVAPLGYASDGKMPGGAATSGHASERVANAWISPLGGGGRISGDGNAATLDWWSAGIAGGYEGTLDLGAGQAFAGFGLGYTRSRGTVDARLSRLDADGFHAGAYGAWTDGAWRLSGSLAYAAHRVSTTRRITFGAIDRTATASYWSHSLGLSSEAAYAIELGGGTTLLPLATLDAGWSGHGGFSERGADALDLTGLSASRARFDTGLGIGVSHAMPTRAGRLVLEGRAVWEHAFANVVPGQSLGLAGSPTGFQVRGPRADRNRLRVGAGLSWDVAPDMTVRANYEGVFSGRQSNHTATLGLNVRF